MDCGISFGINKWALTSGLGLLSLAGYETYQLAIKPVATSRHFSMELMEYSVPEEIDSLEIPVPVSIEEEPAEIVDVQPEMEAVVEEITQITEEVVEETEELESQVESEISIKDEEKVISIPTPTPEEPVASKVEEDQGVSQEAPIPGSGCLFTFTNHTSRQRLGSNYQGKFFCSTT